VVDLPAGDDTLKISLLFEGLPAGREIRIMHGDMRASVCTGKFNGEPNGH
jgi:hypothetical protein